MDSQSVILVNVLVLNRNIIAMKIAIMGTGGQGGLFGALLKKAGHDVTLIARGRNLEAIKEKGLSLESKTFGDHTITANATSKPEDVGITDLILFCVKTYDLEEAARQIKPMIGPDTIVLTVQNGVEAPTRVGEIIGSEHVIAGVSIINSHLISPGVVRHAGGKNLSFGETSRVLTQRVQNLEKIFKEIGFDAVASKNIKFNLWRKLTSLSGLHGVVCLTRSSIGTVHEYEETWDLMRKVMLETASVARAEGVTITREMIEATLKGISKMPPEVKPSMMVDLEAGRRIELETFNGAVIRFGKKHGIDTPYNYSVYAALKPYEKGTQTT
jgi:2-dehydropantoate 2-reductase